ncbi:MAG TPA: patatin-like phospholipase family protein [Candidatus Saccharimonadales bacterium]|nr:patatin-like phospholipase family protein [Candidatus Saccharimonadales bacterium]
MSNPEVPILGEWAKAGQLELVMEAKYLGAFSHIGSLKTLEKHGIGPDSMGGVSAGAEILGLSAAGKTAEEIEEFVTGIRREDVLDPDYTFGLFKGRPGLLKGLLLQEKFREAVGDVRIQDLPRSLRISVTDIRTWSAEAVTEGDLALAITASSAFPGLIQPQVMNGRLKWDGGIKDHSGLLGSPKNKRTLLIGAKPQGFRSRFDRGNAEAFEGRTNTAIVRIPGLPPVSPFNFEELGPKAIKLAMEYTEQALHLPVEGQFGEASP